LVGNRCVEENQIDSPLSFQKMAARRYRRRHGLPPTRLPGRFQHLATVIYEPDYLKRSKALAKALEDIKGIF
jgi:hypothetical protein